MTKTDRRLVLLGLALVIAANAFAQTATSNRRKTRVVIHSTRCQNGGCPEKDRSTGEVIGVVTASPYAMVVTPSTNAAAVDITLTVPPSTCSGCTGDNARSRNYVHNVKLRSSSPVCTAPELNEVVEDNTTAAYSVRIEGDTDNAAAASVRVVCADVANDQVVTISDDLNGRVSFQLPGILNDIVARTKSIASGGTGVGRVKLSYASRNHIVVALASMNPELVSVPAMVTVPAGATYVDFPIAAGTAAAETVVKIKGTFTGPTGSATKGASVTILP